MCKYCEKGKSICNNRTELGIELYSGERKLIAYGLDKTGWNISVECKINYCPMCGRKLGGSDEWTSDEDECIEKFNKEIDKLSMMFRITFGHKPNYIKIPMWFYIELLEKSELDDDETKEDIYRGLKVCPTIAITEISEIEIF